MPTKRPWVRIPLSAPRRCSSVAERLVPNQKAEGSIPSICSNLQPQPETRETMAKKKIEVFSQCMFVREGTGESRVETTAYIVEVAET